jgi:hypothetical protein
MNGGRIEGYKNPTIELMEVNVKSINLIFFNNLELEVGK